MGSRSVERDLGTLATGFVKILKLSVAVAWSVDLLPSKPGSVPGGAGNCNIYLGTGRVSLVYILSCVFSGSGPFIVLTTHSGRFDLVYLSSVWSPDCCSPCRHLTHGHLGCKYRGV